MNPPVNCIYDTEVVVLDEDGTKNFKQLLSSIKRKKIMKEILI
jgi:ATP-dependent DNA ligase